MKHFAIPDLAYFSLVPSNLNCD